uniref:Ovule protein n=1 Tax=Heterorhabditis bacteriophora TaxID=37862 RepID=A0A1I7WDN0_HETBA
MQCLCVPSGGTLPKILHSYLCPHLFLVRVVTNLIKSSILHAPVITGSAFLILKWFIHVSVNFYCSLLGFSSNSSPYRAIAFFLNINVLLHLLNPGTGIHLILPVSFFSIIMPCLKALLVSFILFNRYSIVSQYLSYSSSFSFKYAIKLTSSAGYSIGLPTQIRTSDTSEYKFL